MNTASEIARQPFRTLTQREIMIQIALMLDTAQRDFADLQKLGAISPEAHTAVSTALTDVTAQLANIRRA